MFHVALACLAHAVAPRVGIATVFHAHGDPQNPDPHAACLHRTLDDNLLGVAHKTLPCRSKLRVCLPRTKRCATLEVVDRGPRRAALDLTRGAAKALKHNGKERVMFWPLFAAPRRRPDS